MSKIGCLPLAVHNPPTASERPTLYQPVGTGEYDIPNQILVWSHYCVRCVVFGVLNRARDYPEMYKRRQAGVFGVRFVQITFTTSHTFSIIMYRDVLPVPCLECRQVAFLDATLCHDEPSTHSTPTTWKRGMECNYDGSTPKQARAGIDDDGCPFLSRKLDCT